jgi:predicted O-methyltransferase YrrM
MNSKLPIVEIGAFKGKSTCYLGLGSKLGNKVPVHSIDPHTGNPEHKARNNNTDIWTYDIYCQNIKKYHLDNIILPILDYSYNVVSKFADNSLNFIFIDGEHSYEACRQDLLDWTPKIVSGGNIMLHDCSLDGKTGWKGPNQVVDEYLRTSNVYKNLRSSGNDYVIVTKV